MGLLRKLGIGVAALLGLGVVGIAGIAMFAHATADTRIQFPDTPSPDIRASSDPAVIARGRYLAYGPAHCQGCHGTTDRDNPAANAEEAPLAGGLEFAMGPIGTTWAANLTPDSTGIRGLNDAQLARAIRTGVMHDGRISLMMKFSGARLSDEDLQAVISFLRSQPPVANAVPKGEWGLLGEVLLLVMPMTPRTEAPTHVPESDHPSLARGDYLVNHAAMCVDCHSPLDPSTFRVVEPRFGGSLPDPSHGSDSDHEYVAPNLTSSPVGVTGRLDEDAFVARIRAGRVHRSSIMPWEQLQRCTDADLRSIYRYLRSVPPSDRDPGPSYREKGWTPAGA